MMNKIANTATREPIIYVGGEFVPQSQAKISVLDHAVLYGDGVFETALAWNGRIFKLEEHIDRMERSLAAINCKSPVGRDELRKTLIESVRINKLENAYIKWIVTRGSNGRPLMDPAGCVPNLIIITLPYIDRYADANMDRGIRMKTVAVRRPSGQVLDPRIKSLNYLNLVLAKIEAKATGADDALMLNLEGRICEATGNNVFLVHGRKLSTPAQDILFGITRETVIELAKARGYDVVVGELELYDAYCADEIILCSTAGGLAAVTELDGRTIGGGRPGPAFRTLSEAYLELIASDRYGTAV